MNKNLAAPAFYLGTLISSVGSLTFNVCLIAFMIQAGFDLGEASLIIGLQRLVPVIVIGAWGHLTDRFPAKSTVIICELIAAVASFLLLKIWHGASTQYPLLVLLCVARAVVVSFQTGSRAKLAKLFSDGTYSGNSKNAIWFNKATQGATLFSGLLAWQIIQHFNLETAIIFDAITFVVSGFAVMLISVEGGQREAPNQQDSSWKEKFGLLFKYNPHAAVLDLLLAVSMMGTVAFMARMADGNQTWTGKFMASYGLAVWLAGFLERKVTTKFASAPFWFVMSGSFALLGMIAAPGWLTLGLFFLKDLSYWIILHRISSYIQMDSPASQMGAISSARTSLMIAILAIGEILVGSWANVVPIWLEAAMRALVLVSIGVYLLSPKLKQVVLNDRPAL